MNHKKSSGIIYLFVGIVFIILGIVFATNSFGLPKVDFIERYPLFISGVLFAIGIVLVVRAFKKDEGKNDDE